MTQREAIIRFNDFSCGYFSGKPPVLKNINLGIREGELVLIAGGSGSGSTTLGLSLIGIIPHVTGWTEGSVVVDGLSVGQSQVAMLATRVGIVFQDIDAQLTNLYVKDEVLFGPENLALPVEEVVQRAEEALGFVGAGEYRDRFVFELSGGQKQKVIIAAVLAMRPKILFFDKPTANLDPKSASEVFRLLNVLKQEGRTILVSESKMDELAVGADRLLVLGDGGVRFDGDPRELLRDHGRELQERWGLWIPEAAELELKLRQRKNLFADPFPIHSSEAIERYRHYHFSRFPNGSRATRSESRKQHGEVIIRAENVSYTYADGTQAVKDASLEVRAGEVLAIVGPNGSGKTTLSKQFVGLLKPTQGKVVVFGMDTSRVGTRELTRRIGYVFQYPEHQFVRDTVKDEIGYSLKVLGVTEGEIELRVKEMRAVFGLEDLEERHPYSLSGGEKRRLSVATMIIVRPSVLLLDEPTYAQDRQNTERIMEAVFRVTADSDEANRSTLLLVTHDMKLVARYATRVIAMHLGRIEFDGPPGRLFEDRSLLTKVNLEDPPFHQIIRSLRQADPSFPEEIESPDEFVDAVVSLDARHPR